MASRRAILICGLAAALLATAAGGDKYRLADRWSNPNFDRRELRNLLIVGITDDQEARHRFEDKFVSHLRGRAVKGMTSYSLVPDLTVIEDKAAVITTLMEQKIDGAISVRVVPVAKKGEDLWIDAWNEGLNQEGSLRGLIEESLPAKRVDAKTFGAEITLWNTRSRARIWACRTSTHPRKQLREGAGTYVQLVMDALKDAGLL